MDAREEPDLFDWSIGSAATAQAVPIEYGLDSRVALDGLPNGRVRTDLWGLVSGPGHMHTCSRRRVYESLNQERRLWR